MVAPPSAPPLPAHGGTSSTAAPSVAALQAALRRCGHAGFRPGQAEAIRATLEGRDSLLILPTGGGKSLTFQLPPVARGGCFTVVVSPLLALAADQVEKCLDGGLEAALWNSTTSDIQRKSIMSELVSDTPDLQLLYTTPESLLKPALRDALKEAHAAGTICSFAIDEAHCISEWGHDFRPAYLQLRSLKDEYPGVPIAAVTASATPRVQASIIECLGLQSPELVTASFNRANIRLTVRHKALIGRGRGSDDDVVEDLLAFIAERPGQCGIIYARLRTTCDWLAGVLSGADLDVAKYHAGMEQEQRAKVLRDWSAAAIDVVVATIAFGMGIDRADVRWVAHWNLPSSVEGFYQEAGRAGRDGQPAISLVYESEQDAEAVAKLERGNRQGSMAAVSELMSTPGCLRRRLLAFFGEARGPCDAAAELPCDFCRDPPAFKRRLAERGRRVEARLQREALEERRRLMGDGGDGGGSSNDGDGGGGGDEEDGPSRCGGWGSAALLRSHEEPPQRAGDSLHMQAGAAPQQIELPVPPQPPPLQQPQPQQQQQQPPPPARPVLGPLNGAGRLGRGRGGMAFKPPSRVGQATAGRGAVAGATQDSAQSAAAAAPEAQAEAAEAEAAAAAAAEAEAAAAAAGAGPAAGAPATTTAALSLGSAAEAGGGGGGDGSVAHKVGQAPTAVHARPPAGSLPRLHKRPRPSVGLAQSVGGGGGCGGGCGGGGGGGDAGSEADEAACLAALGVASRAGATAGAAAGGCGPGGGSGGVGRAASAQALSDARGEGGAARPRWREQGGAERQQDGIGERVQDGNGSRIGCQQGSKGHAQGAQQQEGQEERDGASSSGPGQALQHQQQQPPAAVAARLAAAQRGAAAARRAFKPPLRRA